MADNLRRLASSEVLRSLLEKVDSWLRNYNTNSCDENLSICLELIEQVAKLEGQLFGIFTVTAQEGGHYGGVEIIKSRLLPWLEASFTAPSGGKPNDGAIPSLQETLDKDKNSLFRDQDLQLESDLQETRDQLKQVQDDLTETEKTLEETKNRSAISLLAAEEEINQLKKQLKSLQSQEEARHRNSDYYTDHRSRERGRNPQAVECKYSEVRTLDLKDTHRRSLDQRNPEALADYEKHLQMLKDEIAVLSAEKNALQDRSSRSRSPSPDPRSRSRSASRSASRPPSRPASRPASRPSSRAASPSNAVAKVRSPSPNRSKLSNMARKAALLSRFSDVYSQARLDTQCLLRRCIDNAETVQRIIYIATVEAFHVAKMAFRHFKIRLRKTLTPNYAGSKNFEDVVSDYIICHLDMYDAQSSVNDVIRAMNVNPKISSPPEVDFCLLRDFIQEICCIAFVMQTLDPPLDIAFGADGEIFNDYKYRRSYDSDFTAPLVYYHVWPALMENDCVIMKGEAVTRRGAFWNSVRPVTRCRSRSLSPVCHRSHISLTSLTNSDTPS
ncbi:PREDICTED: mitochondria-eating protein, partial [Elephantulus edwardii]|uniref:mitochondria-eating protein n=1 Tax=Elephantulus edwardii TaxID=28737 RepID=UPI0003F06403